MNHYIKTGVAALLWLFLMLLAVSCNKKVNLPGDTETPSIVSAGSATEGIAPYQEGTPTILGTPKAIPYTVRNMNMAMQALVQKGIITRSGATVRPTHYYVRFRPSNEEQYETLAGDTTLALSDIPIESTVIQQGDYYRDPSLTNDTVPTFQYASVKTDYNFPKGIAYDIIEQLYLPEEDAAFNYDRGGSEDLYVEKLLNEAFRLSGNNLDTIPAISQTQVETLRYRPGGRIRVFDTRVNAWIGMEGVRVQARRWFIVYTAFPDYNGFYQMRQSYKRPCNYSIWFARETFSVRHNLVNTTFWINGPKQTGEWNYDLNNGYQRFAGHVFRGAFRYHNKNIAGLQRPWIPFKRQVYVAVDGNKNWSGVNWIVFPVIRVARYEDKGLEYGSDEIFSTTCHETGHTSHVLRMNAGVIQYWQVSGQLQESWAVGIEWYLTHIEYDERGIRNYGFWDYLPADPPQFPNNQAYQYWTLNVSKEYTSLYINLWDRENDQAIYPATAGIPNDQVSGYSIPTIEQKMLKHIYGHSSLAEQLKLNKPAGVTDAQIDLLITSY